MTQPDSAACLKSASARRRTVEASATATATESRSSSSQSPLSSPTAPTRLTPITCAVCGHLCVLARDVRKLLQSHRLKTARNTCCCFLDCQAASVRSGTSWGLVSCGGQASRGGLELGVLRVGMSGHGLLPTISTAGLELALSAGLGDCEKRGGQRPAHHGLVSWRMAADPTADAR